VATRALVLGSGGATGGGWEAGVVAGLAEHGVDLAAADLIVGSSAGAVVGACLAAGTDPQALYRDQLAPPRGSARKLSPWMAARLSAIILTSGDPVRLRTRAGKLALAARTGPGARRLQEIRARLPVTDWPSKPLKVTAVDVNTGEFVVFDATGPVSLVDAVAASTAAPGVQPPVTIGGRRYMDGGLRSVVSADLAAGFDRVVILSPVARGNRLIPGPHQQSAELTGASVAVVTPDTAVIRGMFDPSRRAAAARAGHAQAASVAERVRAVWSG
jgi:NTE family protein